MKKARLILLVAVMVGLAAVSVWASPAAEVDLGGMIPQAGSFNIKTPQVAVEAVAPKV